MTLDYEAVKKIINIRYPFLMIDKVTALEKGRSLTAVKNVTGNEAYFAGHFPDRAVMPGVLMIEASAQASAILAAVSGEETGKEPVAMLFGGVDKMRFLSPVVPGDQLTIRVEAVKLMRTAGMTKVRVSVGDRTVAEGTLLFSKAKDEG